MLVFPHAPSQPFKLHNIHTLLSQSNQSHTAQKLLPVLTVTGPRIPPSKRPEPLLALIMHANIARSGHTPSNRTERTTTTTNKTLGRPCRTRHYTAQCPVLSLVVSIRLCTGRSGASAVRPSASTRGPRHRAHRIASIILICAIHKT